ncbi:TPA: GntR family transcriptional regulator, partial [Streptococcus pyogenes]
MNPIIEAVKQNLDLSRNIPLKIAFYNALKKTIILRQIPVGSRINEKEFS